MSTSFVIPVDPVRLDRLPAPEPQSDEDTPTTPTNTGELVAGWIDRLAAISPLEADLIELRARGCVERDLSVVFGMSQAAISYRYARGIDRIRYMQWRDSLGLDRWKMYPDLEALGMNPVEVEVVIAIWETASTTETTRRLMLDGGQAKVSRIWKAFGARVANAGPRYEVYRTWVAGHRWYVMAELPWPDERKQRTLEVYAETSTTAMRSRILDLVAAEPGIRSSDIRRRLGLTRREWETCSQQLLERGKVETSGTKHRGLRYFTRTSP